jgi:hypothetical protein
LLWCTGGEVVSVGGSSTGGGGGTGRVTDRDRDIVLVPFSPIAMMPKSYVPPGVSPPTV